jgi:hypothetical protein
MCKFRNILIIFFSIIFVGFFFVLDYSDLSWSKNKGIYIGFIVCVLSIINMIMSNKHEKAKSIINQ